MPYKHITVEDRSTIATLIAEQRSNSYIARRIGVNRSTIGREIKRNQTKPKPEQLAQPPQRPALLDIDCRHKRGSGLAQDKYEATTGKTRSHEKKATRNIENKINDLANEIMQNASTTPPVATSYLPLVFIETGVAYPF